MTLLRAIFFSFLEHMYDRSLGDDDGEGISQTITVGPAVQVI